MDALANHIAGEMVPPASGGYLPNHDPSTGTVYSEIPDSDERDVARAVDAAREAFPGWSRRPATERSQCMLRLADLIERDLEPLARAETVDNGKPITLSRTIDIPRAVANFRFFATAILHSKTDAHATDDATLNYTLRTPLGVAGCISPWNLPLYLFSWKVAPALAAGNTVVGKPSEVTPMTAFLLSGLLEEAGFPPGVLNVVHGRGDRAGAAIVAHPDVPAVSFTGGTVTGATIARVAAPMFKKLSLELGGKNPTIVFADADLDEAVPGAVRAAFANQGQICLCGSRVLVARPIYDAFLDAFVTRTKALTCGDPLEETTLQGAVVSAQHLEKVMGCLALARDEGGTVVCGGSPPAKLPARCQGGWFLEPAVVTGLDAACRTNQEEIFGPVASVIPFDDDEDAIAIANGTRYGLSASIWTRDLDRAHRTAAALDAGTVWVNCWLVRDLRVPFGGVKDSGVGREGGDEALRFFTEAKNVCIRLRDETRSATTRTRHEQRP